MNSNEYVWTASPIEPSFGLGALLFVEVHRRILHGEFGSIPKSISDDAFAQAGYCLDAPEDMPAGCCYYASTGPGEGLPDQRTVSRSAVQPAEGAAK